MISIERALVVAMNLLVISTACGVTREAVPEERDYRVIVERNPFGSSRPRRRQRTRRRRPRRRTRFC